ncbi:MAG TPA: hypothetical protein VFL90_08540, partial [Methylomirabilota bacterium]|nr:hypothetical protein [Methylomirabilota bacterium]
GGCRRGRLAPAMRWPAVALASLLLSGCASYAWYRPDATPEMLARDEAQCEGEARAIERDVAWSRGPLGWGWRGPYPLGATGLDVEQDALHRCMEYRGYRLEKETSQRGQAPTPPGTVGPAKPAP